MKIRLHKFLACSITNKINCHFWQSIISKSHLHLHPYFIRIAPFFLLGNAVDWQEVVVPSLTFKHTKAKGSALHRHLLCFKIHSFIFAIPFYLLVGMHLSHFVIHIFVYISINTAANVRLNTVEHHTLKPSYSQTKLYTWTQRGSLIRLFSLFLFHQDTHTTKSTCVGNGYAASMFRSIVLTISSFTFLLLLELYCWMCVVLLFVFVCEELFCGIFGNRILFCR